MEKIKFVYEFNESDNKEMTDTKKIVVNREAENGLSDSAVCEMFLDFMNSIGYSEENVFGYFN